ncbi:hypothetical protein ABK040_005798 [Willaertia magna]
MPESNPYKQAAKAIKAKGLQKLKYYCQMCQKQCRDASGFKSHLLSESHQRQMQIFRSNPSKFINEFSSQFQKGFLDILKSRHAKKRVPALKVYNEYITERHHVHMNSTKWTSLSSFVKFLGKTGICKVDYDEEKDAWFIQYLADNNLQTSSSFKQLSHKEEEEEDDDTKKFKLYEQQLQALKKIEEKTEKALKEEIEQQPRKKQEGKISFSIPSIGANKKVEASSSSSITSDEDQTKKRKLNEFEQQQSLITNDEKEEENKEKLKKQKHVDNIAGSGWLKTQVIVKIIDKSLSEYNQKGIIIKTLQKKRVAQLELLNQNGKIIQVHQDQIQTVTPAIGGKVKILKHKTMRGKIGILEKVDMKNSCATIKLENVLGDNILVIGLDDFSKLYEE